MSLTAPPEYTAGDRDRAIRQLSIQEHAACLVQLRDTRKQIATKIKEIDDLFAKKTSLLPIRWTWSVAQDNALIEQMAWTFDLVDAKSHIIAIAALRADLDRVLARTYRLERLLARARELRFQIMHQFNCVSLLKSENDHRKLEISRLEKKLDELHAEKKKRLQESTVFYRPSTLFVIQQQQQPQQQRLTAVQREIDTCECKIADMKQKYWFAVCEMRRLVETRYVMFWYD